MNYLPSTPSRQAGYEVGPTLESYGYNIVHYVVIQTKNGERCPVAKIKNMSGMYMYLLMDDNATCRVVEQCYVEDKPGELTEDEKEDLRLRQGKFSGLVFEDTSLDTIQSITVIQYMDNGDCCAAKYATTNQQSGTITRHTYPLVTLAELRPNTGIINTHLDTYWIQRNSKFATDVINNLSIITENAVRVMNQLREIQTDITREIYRIRDLFSRPVDGIDAQARLHRIIELGNELASANRSLVTVRCCKGGDPEISMNSTRSNIYISQ